MIRCEEFRVMLWNHRFFSTLLDGEVLLPITSFNFLLTSFNILIHWYILPPSTSHPFILLYLSTPALWFMPLSIHLVYYLYQLLSIPLIHYLLNLFTIVIHWCPFLLFSTFCSLFLLSTITLLFLPLFSNVQQKL